MDTLLETLSNLIPFSLLYQKLGISEELSLSLAVVSNAVLVVLLSKIINSLLRRLRNSKLEKNLRPQFDYLCIKQATQFYIPTYFQNASPTREEEPEFTHKYISRSPLIPFFIRTAFQERQASERFYLILADSGMGKTTFLINLYLKYISFWNTRKIKGVNIKLYRLGYSESLELVRNINRNEARNTILLLDALDEDPFILPQTGKSEYDAFHNRVDEIIEVTKNFRTVILTCRTQYFPSQEENPYELKIKRPDEQGYYILNKLYISPFNNMEVKKFLNNKYHWWKFWTYGLKKRAKDVVRHSSKLLVRPMLLSFIDPLVEEEKSYDTLFVIYETLIEKWLIREAIKRKRIKERDQFIADLHNLSMHLALAMFRNYKEKKGLYIEKEEAFDIAINNGINLQSDEITGKSLLTCDGLGNWKFAHKSILEFFLFQHTLQTSDDELYGYFDRTGTYSQLLYEVIVTEFMDKRNNNNTKFYEYRELHGDTPYKSIRNCDYKNIFLLLFILENDYTEMEPLKYFYLLPELEEIYLFHTKITYKIYLLLYINLLENKFSAQVEKHYQRFKNILAKDQLEFLIEKESWLEDFFHSKTKVFSGRLHNPKHNFYNILSNELEHALGKRKLVQPNTYESVKSIARRLKKFLEDLTQEDIAEIFDYIQFCNTINDKLKNFNKPRIRLY